MGKCLNFCPRCEKPATAEVEIDLKEGAMFGILSCPCGWETSFRTQFNTKDLESLRKEYGKDEGVVGISMMPETDNEEGG